MKNTAFAALAVLVAIGFATGARAATTTPIIILKLDDLKGDRNPRNPIPWRWKRVADLLESRKLHASMGIIGKDMGNDDRAFFTWVRATHQRGFIEFWNHGYTHGKEDYQGKKVAEFQMPYEKQKGYFQKTQRLAKEKLGFPFVAFGAPFNAIDATTARVLQENSDLKIWLFGNVRLAREGRFSKTVLERRANLEHPTLKPNFAKFKEQFARNRTRQYLVLQGHPGCWDDARFKEFERIVTYLQEQKCTFMTPSGYVKWKSGAKRQ